MNKRLEFSEDMKSWKTIGACTDEEYSVKWANLQKWIYEQQPYGFFRAVDDTRDVETIFKEV
jgi:hypothetical protein